MKFSKRFLALFLSVVLIFSTLPLGSQAAVTDPLVVTVQNSSGELLTSAIVFVTTVDGTTRAINEGDGTYQFEKPAVTDVTYDVHVSCSGYYAKLVNDVTPDTDALTVTLDSSADATWTEFGVFYKADGMLPTGETGSDYCAPGESPNAYGPSGDGTPLVTVKVNYNRLVEIWGDAGTKEVYHDLDGVTHGSSWFGTTNNFELASSQISTDAVTNRPYCQNFWNCVKQCMEFESEQAFRATNLFDVFIAYSLKEEDAWWGDPTRHLDGILDVEPPVYVIETYFTGTDNTKVSLGGFVTDTVANTNPVFPTMEDVRLSYNEHLNQDITWDTEANTGTFIEGHDQYTITLRQTNTVEVTPDGSEIGYEEKKSDTYYVAVFEVTLSSKKQIAFTVTYTDGLPYESVFTDDISVVTQEEVDDGATIPAFDYTTGSTDRKGYFFQGWTLEGGDGTLLTDGDIAKMPVTGDMVFVAHYVPIFTVTFHANLPTTDEDIIFRTYYPAGHVPDNGENCYELDDHSQIPGDTGTSQTHGFYAIPEFDDDATHNQYIFKGWYRYENNDTSTDPIAISWEDLYQSNTHIYAQWIEVTSVTQEAADEKQNVPGGSYAGFDLAGTQIRYTETQEDPWYDYSQDQTGPGSGLRFIGVLSTQVEDALRDTNAANASGIAYGFAMAKSATTAKYAGSTEGYQLHIPDANVNGVDTRTAYKYSKNILCSGLSRDHYNGEGYRLYTAVVTFKNGTGYDIDFLTRSYLRYYDANGLYRTHYNNYTGDSAIYSGCSASYDDVKVLVQQITGA